MLSVFCSKSSLGTRNCRRFFARGDESVRKVGFFNSFLTELSEEGYKTVLHVLCNTPMIFSRHIYTSPPSCVGL